MFQLTRGRRLWLPVVLVPLVLLSLFASHNAGATTLIPMTVGEIVDEAELIFVGTAQSLEVTHELYQAFEESPVEEWPFRYVTFVVNEVLKGGVAEQALTLRFLGGGGNDLTYGRTIVGSPKFEVGTSYLLFVKGNGSQWVPLVGWTQGQLTMLRDPKTGEDILLDSSGTMLTSIEDGKWQRVASTQPEIVVRGPGQQSALSALRFFVTERESTDTYAPGKVVTSASPGSEAAGEIIE